MIAALRVADLRLLWAGQLLSSLGSWLLFVAVPYRVFQLTGSAAATGVTFVAGLPPVMLSPVAGALADRWDRRRTMLAADLGRAAAILPLLVVQRPGQLWIVYSALLAESLLGQVFDPAAQALLPAVAGRGPELASANALLAAGSAVSRLAGASLAGSCSRPGDWRRSCGSTRPPTWRRRRPSCCWAGPRQRRIARRAQPAARCSSSGLAFAS